LVERKCYATHARAPSRAAPRHAALHRAEPSRAEWMWSGFAVSDIDFILLLLVTDVIMDAVDDW